MTTLGERILIFRLRRAIRRNPLLAMPVSIAMKLGVLDKAMMKELLTKKTRKDFP